MDNTDTSTFKNKNYNLKNIILSTALGLAISTNAALAQNRNYINPADQKSKTNTSLVIDNYTSVDPFKHVIPGQTCFVNFALLNSNNNAIKYQVITFDEYTTRFKNAINNKLENNKNWAEKAIEKLTPDVLLDWFGYDKDTDVSGERLLKYIQNSPYTKLQLKSNIANLVEQSLNNIDKICLSNKSIDMKGTLTPAEIKNINNALKNKKYSSMIIPVVAYTNANCKNPGEQVPVLLLFEQNCTTTPVPTKKTITPKKPYVTPVPKKEPEKKIVEKPKQDNITNNYITNLACPQDTVIVNINNYYTIHKDTIINQIVQKSKIRPYIALGAEKDLYLNGIKQDLNLKKLVPQAAIGLQYKAFSFGINGGYRELISHEIESYPDGLGNGGTYVNKDIDTKLTKYGLETSVDIARILTLYLGAQNHIVKTNITGTVEMDVKDEGGNWRYKKIPLEPENFTTEFITLNPGLGIKFNKNISLYAGPEYDINTGKITAGHAWLRYTFGGNKYNNKQKNNQK